MVAPESFAIGGARAVLPEGASPGPVEVVVEEGWIAAVGEAPARELPRIDASGLWLVPGWIDIQVNDMAWLGRGPASPEAHASRIREVARFQAGRGVTGFVLATLAAPVEEILAYLRGMKQVLDEAREPAAIAFLGGFVEGTFMNPELHGAHNPRSVLTPDRGVLDRFLDTGAVRLVNIAPEVSDTALDLTRHATARGAVVGCGHAKPHAERVREAVAAGLRFVIHLGNGPTGSSWKAFHDGGLLEEALRNDALLASVIADGYHVHPQLLRDWIARKEVSRVIGISDAGFAAGVPEGPFEVLGIRGEPAGGGKYLQVAGGPERNPRSSDAVALFGSAVGMREVFENLLNLLAASMPGVHQRWHEALPFAEAIAAAARMCSRNPAALLGLEDRGAIEPGRRADLLLLRLEGTPGACGVRLEGAFLGGRRCSEGVSGAPGTSGSR